MLLIDSAQDFAGRTGPTSRWIEASLTSRSSAAPRARRSARRGDLELAKGWISADAAFALGERQASSGYGEYVMDVARRAGAGATG